MAAKRNGSPLASPDTAASLNHSTSMPERIGVPFNGFAFTRLAALARAKIMPFQCCDMATSKRNRVGLERAKFQTGGSRVRHFKALG